MQPEATISGAGCLRRLRLDRNEPTGGVDIIGSYPDPSSLIGVLAATLGVPTSSLVLTAGADQAIDVACRGANGEALLLAPDFVRYVQHVENAGLKATFVRVPVDTGYFPLDEFLLAVAKQPSVVIVSTVGNPTGYVVPADLIDRIRAVAPRTFIIIDEVYRDFAPVSFLAAAASLPGVVVIGSLSKSIGPGLRIGYIVGSEPDLQRIRCFVSPVAVSALSVEAGSRALSNPLGIKKAVSRQVAARQRLAAGLRHRGFDRVIEGANWVNVDVGSGAARLLLELGLRGVAVNRHPDPALDRWIRVSTPSTEDVDAFLDVFDEVTGSPFIEVLGQFELRDIFMEPTAWLQAPFVMRDEFGIAEIDHVAITAADEDEHLEFVARLVAAGATLVEGPGLWPHDFCEDLVGFPRDLEMHFATLAMPSGGLVVIAAPARANDQIARFRKQRGALGVHHVALRVENVEASAQARAQSRWVPTSASPTESGGLRQWFLRNPDDQILELISRLSNDRTTFSCGNLAALRRSEERAS